MKLTAWVLFGPSRRRPFGAWDTESGAWEDYYGQCMMIEPKAFTADGYESWRKKKSDEGWAAFRLAGKE